MWLRRLSPSLRRPSKSFNLADVKFRMHLPQGKPFKQHHEHAVRYPISRLSRVFMLAKADAVCVLYLSPFPGSMPANPRTETGEGWPWASFHGCFPTRVVDVGKKCAESFSLPACSTTRLENALGYAVTVCAGWYIPSLLAGFTQTVRASTGVIFLNLCT